MTVESWIVAAILTTAVLFFITEWLRMDVGAGSYHFGDYMKVGLPMILLTQIFRIVRMNADFSFYLRLS